jgi:hypothetical protein
MRKSPVDIGDEVVHQSHPGRFSVIRIEPRPSLNVYSNIVTIRSAAGVELRVLDTTVRKLPPKDASPAAK